MVLAARVSEIKEHFARVRLPVFRIERFALTHPGVLPFNALLDISVAEGAAEVKPHCVADDFVRETMTAIVRRGCVHQRIKPHVRSANLATLFSLIHSFLRATIGSTLVARLAGM